MVEPKLTKGQQTREQLLAAALQQFAAQGYHGTSMRQIAEAAGLAVGGIYNHFASKEEILKAVILTYHPLTFIAPLLAELEGESLEVLLRTAARRLYTAAKAHPALFSVLFIELFECRGVHLPELAETLLPNVLAFAQRLQQLQSGMAAQPPLAVLRLFLGSLVGFLITEMVLVKVLPPTTEMGTLDDAVDLLLQGLRPA